MKTPEQIALDHVDDDGSDLAKSMVSTIVSAIEADRAQRPDDGDALSGIYADDAEEALAYFRETYEDSESVGDVVEPGEDGFAPEGETDRYRDLWTSNMPRLSGRIYLALPGEQPIHLDDELARRVLVELSQTERGLI